MSWSWYHHDHNLREFVQTTVILTPGVGNPGSVLHRWLRFRGNLADPADPVQNSVRRGNAVFYNTFGTFCRNWGFIFGANPEKTLREINVFGFER